MALFDVANDIRGTRQISSETPDLARNLRQEHVDYLRAGIRGAVLRRSEITDVVVSIDSGHSGERIPDSGGNGVSVSGEAI